MVAPAGSGKTSALQELHDRLGLPLINVNLELSKQMLDLPERRRTLQLPRLLMAIANEVSGDLVFLDNIEILSSWSDP
jgi:hypothetical protein